MAPGWQGAGGAAGRAGRGRAGGRRGRPGAGRGRARRGLGALGAQREVAPPAAREANGGRGGKRGGFGGTKGGAEPRGRPYSARGCALRPHARTPRSCSLASFPALPLGFPSSFSCLTCNNNSQDPSGLRVLGGARESKQQGWKGDGSDTPLRSPPCFPNQARLRKQIHFPSPGLKTKGKKRSWKAIQGRPGGSLPSNSVERASLHIPTHLCTSRTPCSFSVNRGRGGSFWDAGNFSKACSAPSTPD